MKYLQNMKTGPVTVIDPSEIHRPEEIADRPVESYRNFDVNDKDPIQERIRVTYKNMHTYQTVNFVKEKMKEWLNFKHFKATMKEALIKLNDLVDESDPDLDIPNIVHAFQTAEKIRQDFPELDWFHLTGLIHDVGKVMAFYGLPQWCVVGDTFVVGCHWEKDIVYRDWSFEDNPDGKDPKYNTTFGMYKPNCGLNNVLMSWGHDEYLYHMLKHNKTTLPDEALYAIKYHSFYPWHTSNNYEYLTNAKDKDMKKWVKYLNRYDLYTKSETIPDFEALWPYYEELIDKYIPGELEW